MDSRRFLYVLESLASPDRHYAGLTANVAQRLAHHNAGRSQHTATFRPWRLLMSLEFADAGRAALFERYLKSGSGRAFAKRHFCPGSRTASARARATPPPSAARR